MEIADRASQEHLEQGSPDGFDLILQLVLRCKDNPEDRTTLCAVGVDHSHAAPVNVGMAGHDLLTTPAL